MKSIRILGIAVSLLVSTVAFSQIGLKGIGGGVGYAGSSLETTAGTSTSSESLGGFAIGGAANLGNLMNNLSLVPEVGFWTASKSSSTGGVSSDFSISDFLINANVVYALGQSQLVPYVGGGLGINFVSTTVEVPPITTPFGTFGGKVSGSATRLGINVFGGAAYALSSQMSVGAQFRYALVSDFNHFMILATVMYNLDSM